MPKPIDALQMGPTRSEVQNPDGSWTITVTPPRWSTFLRPSIIRLTPDQYERYYCFLNGKMIQDALPDLSVADREALLSGIGSEDWDDKVKSDDD